MPSRAARLERGSKAFRKSIDYTNPRSKGYMSLKEDGFGTVSKVIPVQHDPFVNPMPFNNQNPYMIDNKALPKTDPLVRES